MFRGRKTQAKVPNANNAPVNASNENTEPLPDEKETLPFKEILLTMNEEIVTSLIQELLKPTLKDDEISKNARMIISFYMNNYRLGDLLKMCIKRDFYLQVSNPTAYSPYSRLFSELILDVDRETFVSIQNLLNRKVAKLKDSKLDDSAKKVSEKDLSKYKGIVENFVNIWMETEEPKFVYINFKLS